MILGSDTLTRLRGQSRDRFGDLAGTDDELDITGCSVQPTASSESTDRGELIITSLTVYMPGGTDFVATDRARWLGDVYEVDGQPAGWSDQAANAHHVQLQLKLVQGQG